MIQVSAHAFAVDDGLAVLQSIKVCAARTIVKLVGLLRTEPRPEYSTTREPLRMGVVVKTPAA